MNVNLTPALQKFIQKKVASGRYNSASEVVRESLRLLQDFDRVKVGRFQHLQREIEVGLRQAEAGQIRPFDAKRVKERVRKEAARYKKER